MSYVFGKEFLFPLKVQMSASTRHSQLKMTYCAKHPGIFGTLGPDFFSYVLKVEDKGRECLFVMFLPLFDTLDGLLRTLILPFDSLLWLVVLYSKKLTLKSRWRSTKESFAAEDTTLSGRQTRSSWRGAFQRSLEVQCLSFGIWLLIPRKVCLCVKLISRALGCATKRRIGGIRNIC